jgi:hypothetical protein
VVLYEGFTVACIRKESNYAELVPFDTAWLAAFTGDSDFAFEYLNKGACTKISSC